MRFDVIVTSRAFRLGAFVRALGNWPSERARFRPRSGALRCDRTGDDLVYKAAHRPRGFARCRLFLIGTSSPCPRSLGRQVRTRRRSSRRATIDRPFFDQWLLMLHDKMMLEARQSDTYLGCLRGSRICLKTPWAKFLSRTTSVRAVGQGALSAISPMRSPLIISRALPDARDGLKPVHWRFARDA